jgi:hypothetical protein
VHVDYELVSQNVDLISKCRELSEEIEAGLDATMEMKGTFDHELGDTICILSEDQHQVDAYAIYHYGKIPAHQEMFNVRFGVARCSKSFDKLLQAIEQQAKSFPMCKTIELGLSTVQVAAVNQAFALGFNIKVVGVNLETSTDPDVDETEYTGFFKPGRFILCNGR